jgi:hypothetical protein
MNRKFLPALTTSWMKRAKIALTGVAFLLVAQAVFVKPASATLITYNANSAFSAMEAGSVSGTNPFLPFSVGYANEALSLPGSFVAFAAAQHTNSFFGNANLQGYFFDNNAEVPAVVVNTASSAQSFHPSIEALDPGQIFMHPGGIGPNAFTLPIYGTVVRFTTPTAGVYTIAGDWESLHSGTTQNQILRNGTSLFSDTAADINFNLTVALNAGDYVDFVVRSFGDIGSDSTGLRATLSTEIPEPGSIALLGLGLAGLSFCRRKQT